MHVSWTNGAQDALEQNKMKIHQSGGRRQGTEPCRSWHVLDIIALGLAVSRPLAFPSLQT